MFKRGVVGFMDKCGFHHQKTKGTIIEGTLCQPLRCSSTEFNVIEHAFVLTAEHIKYRVRLGGYQFDQLKRFFCKLHLLYCYIKSTYCYIGRCIAFKRDLREIK